MLPLKTIIKTFRHLGSSLIYFQTTISEGTTWTNISTLKNNNNIPFAKHITNTWYSVYFLICRLILEDPNCIPCRGVHQTASDDETQVLEICRVVRTLLFQLLSGSQWPRTVIPLLVPSMYQIFLWKLFGFDWNTCSYITINHLYQE